MTVIVYIPLWRPDSLGSRRPSLSYLGLMASCPGIIDHCQSLWTTTHSRHRILKTLHAKLKSTWSTPRLVATVMAKGKPSDLWVKTLLLTMPAIQLCRIRKWRRSENRSGEA